MGDALVALGGAFLAAGLLARMGRRLGLPTIALFMAAGIIFGPHTAGLDLVEDPAELELVATLGLILLLFHLGLEFSLGDLLAGGRRLVAAGTVYLLLNVGGGALFGLALGWGTGEALVVAGAVGISSSAIVTKLLVELRRLANPEARPILGIVVVQDIFITLYLVLLQPVFGDSEGAGGSLLAIGRALGLLLVLGALARWGAPLVGRLVATSDDELLTVLFVGLGVLVAGVAEELGVSAAIGAFMAGLILAETAVAGRVERLVLPLRDAFAAIFFFTFGVTIEPSDVASVIGPVSLAVTVTVVLSTTASLMAARMYGFGPRPAANLALTLLPRGEFSLVLATLAAAAGLDPRLGPLVAGYVLILALGGPLLAARSAWLARFVPRKLVEGALP